MSFEAIDERQRHLFNWYLNTFNTVLYEGTGCHTEGTERTGYLAEGSEGSGYHTEGTESTGYHTEGTGYHTDGTANDSERTGDKSILHHLHDVKTEIHEMFQECRYGKYRIQMLAFLDTLKRYLEMPLVSMVTFPLIDFIKVLENDKLWNECREDLRTKYGSELYLDLSIERLKKGFIDLYVEAPTMFEVTAIKKTIEDFIKKVITPPEVKVTSPEVKGQDGEVKGEDTEVTKVNQTDNEKVVSQKHVLVQEGRDGKQIYTVEETIHLIQVQNSATINEDQPQGVAQVVTSQPQGVPQVVTPHPQGVAQVVTTQPQGALQVNTTPHQGALHIITTQAEGAPQVVTTQPQRVPEIVTEGAPEIVTQEITTEDNNNNTQQHNAETTEIHPTIEVPPITNRADPNQTNQDNIANVTLTNAEITHNSENVKINFVRSKSVPTGHQALQPRSDSDNINFINIDLGSGEIINETTKAIHRSVSQVLILHLDPGVVS